MTTNSENNIIQLDNYRAEKVDKEPPKTQIVRITSELDGMEALYSSDLSSEHLFTIKILFWALLENGEVCAVIPWLKEVTTTEDLQHKQGRWQGYFDATKDRIFFKAPDHKVKELELGHMFFQEKHPNKEELDALTTPENVTQLKESINQELPDHLGTHAAFKHKDKKGFYLKPVISWKLSHNGDLEAMVPIEDNLSIIPLPGSSDLIAASEIPEFRYYFQHGIATRIKHHDPDAMTTVSLLIDLV